MRWSTIILLGLVVMAAFSLYELKYYVRDLHRQTGQLESEIAKEKRAIHVLEAEWAHLSRPERLQKLSDEYLALAPLGTARLEPVNLVPMRPPLTFDAVVEAAYAE